jgi:hypothetical protein
MHAHTALPCSPPPPDAPPQPTQAIRLAKQGVRKDAPKAYERINNADRPDEAFTTERAQRAGRANAASGRIMVTVPNDHFGPILPEHDPENGKVSGFMFVL